MTQLEFVEKYDGTNYESSRKHETLSSTYRWALGSVPSPSPLFPLSRWLCPMRAPFIIFLPTLIQHFWSFSLPFPRHLSVRQSVIQNISYKIVFKCVIYFFMSLQSTMVAFDRRSLSHWECSRTSEHLTVKIYCNINLLIYFFFFFMFYRLTPNNGAEMNRGWGFSFSDELSLSGWQVLTRQTSSSSSSSSSLHGHCADGSVTSFRQENRLKKPLFSGAE